MLVLKFIFEITQPYRIYLLGMFLAMCFVVIDNTFKPLLVKKFIDIVSGTIAGNLWNIFSWYAFLQLLLVSSWALSDYCLTKHTAKLRLDIIKYFMQRLYDYPYNFFQNQLAGSLTAKINDAFQLLPYIIFAIINPFLYFTFLIFISLALLVSVAPIFAIILMLWILIFFIIVFISMKKNRLVNKNYAEEKSKVLGMAADYLSNMITVQTFAARVFELNRFDTLKTDFLKTAHSLGFYFMKFYTLQGLFTSLYAIGFIFFLIQGYKKGIVSPGDFALIIMTNLNIITTLYQLSHTLRDFLTNWGAVDQALILLENHDLSCLDKPNASNLKCYQGQITFNNVKFHYKDTSILFENKAIKLNAQEKVGLVGYSGAGKSTFVNLILRLYEVTDGAILIDDQDIRSVTQHSLRENIALIPQDPSLFHRSLMDNIRYGKTNARDEKVIEAAKKAHAHEFIIKLPQGYNSMVGERGVKLSGGQRQRIAIARAILKNAPILILDEATSQLDSITESLIQEGLWELMENKTTNVIAHRLSTLLHMDRILVL